MGLRPPDSNSSNFTLPNMPNLRHLGSNRFYFRLFRSSHLSASYDYSTLFQNCPNLLVPNNFRPPAPHNLDPIVENYSGVTNQRNLHPSFLDRHTVHSDLPIPPIQILSQPCHTCSLVSPPGPPCNRFAPCFECVKSNKYCSFPRSAFVTQPGVLHIPTYLPYYQSRVCSRDTSDRKYTVVAVQGTKTMAEFIGELRSAALQAIPSVPGYISFQYYLQGRQLMPNDNALVRDLNWRNDDYVELRAFETNTGLECHGCIAGWYLKSV
ncbi:hypothetical protein EAE96_008502 [Botrytis aclada]|nr:hypothetical protein EAE96_008502 [Botrytis aclada]